VVSETSPFGRNSARRVSAAPTCYSRPRAFPAFSPNADGFLTNDQ